MRHIGKVTSICQNLSNWQTIHFFFIKFLENFVYMFSNIWFHFLEGFSLLTGVVGHPRAWETICHIKTSKVDIIRKKFTCQKNWKSMQNTSITKSRELYPLLHENFFFTSPFQIWFFVVLCLTKWYAVCGIWYFYIDKYLKH